ncbi:amidohydrolase family protein [Nonomuraea mangrovi]|uniref:Amidohydrolase family protein n=1 Tax=Nonomuraea mangrovi TaxID=2316207 RepID=A0ABW4T666_9ACTN
MNDGWTLLRSARLGQAATPVDILLGEGRVARVEERITPESGWNVLDVEGRTVVPGLWDHHVHFDQWTLARQRLDLSSATSAAEAASLVAERLRTRPPEPGLPLVGYGFRDAMWPDRPHRDLLDAAAPTDVPIVLVSGDLHCCWVNAAAAEKYGHAGHPTGILRETEWQAVGEDVARLPEHLLDAWADEAATAAAARGVVGVVELEAPWHLDAWVRRVRAGTVSLRVACGVWPGRLEEAIARGLRTGDVIPGTGGLVEMGPFKVITDGSLNTRTAYCHDPYPGLENAEHPRGMLLVPPHDLIPLMRRAWSNGLRPAVHAIGDHANTLALDAFEELGAHGTIEHAQLLSDSDLPRFAELGVVASVQPEHAMDDRDVADHHWAGRTSRAFPFGALLSAGAGLALGSDAPVAPLDPWISLAAAVDRSRDGRKPWHEEQAIPVAAALAASTRTGRVTPAVGDPADLVVLDADLYTASTDLLRRMPVAATMLAGRWTWREGI